MAILLTDFSLGQLATYSANRFGVRPMADIIVGDLKPGEEALWIVMSAARLTPDSCSWLGWKQVLDKTYGHERAI